MGEGRASACAGGVCDVSGSGRAGACAGGVCDVSGSGRAGACADVDPPLEIVLKKPAKCCILGELPE